MTERYVIAGVITGGQVIEVAINGGVALEGATTGERKLHVHGYYDGR